MLHMFKLFHNSVPMYFLRASSIFLVSIFIYTLLVPQQRETEERERLSKLLYLFIYFYKFIYLFQAALGLCCCARALSSCGEQGLLFVAVRGLLTAVASLVVEHGLQARGLSSCGSWALERRLSSFDTRAQLLRGMWDLPGPGLDPVFPALAGRFLTAALPRKSLRTPLITITGFA